jgi:hypothetical protein
VENRIDIAPATGGGDEIIARSVVGVEENLIVEEIY